MRFSIKHALKGVAIVFGMAVGVQVSAGTIEIQFLGLDLAYDGSTITDASVGPDALTSVTVSSNGSPIAGSPFTTDIGIDLIIPGITDIAVGGDLVTSALGGSLDLSLPGGDFLNLSLGEVTVSFIDLGVAQLAFGASLAGIDSQSLPTGLLIGDPSSITFSATISTLTDDGSNLLTFSGSGTGEVEGIAVPEPGSALMLGILTVFASVTLWEKDILADVVGKRHEDEELKN